MSRGSACGGPARFRWRRATDVCRGPLATAKIYNQNRSFAKTDSAAHRNGMSGGTGTERRMRSAFDDIIGFEPHRCQHRYGVIAVPNNY